MTNNLINNEEVNIVELVKQYLSILGISPDKLNENAGKVLVTVILATLGEQASDSDQSQLVQKIKNLSSEDENKKQKVFDTITDFFAGVNKEVWQKSLVVKLISYLVDMTDKTADSLSEDDKNQLTELIDSLAA